MEKFKTFNLNKEWKTRRKLYFKKTNKIKRKKSFDIFKNKKKIRYFINKNERNLTGYIVKDIMN